MLWSSMNRSQSATFTRFGRVCLSSRCRPRTDLGWRGFSTISGPVIQSFAALRRFDEKLCIGHARYRTMIGLISIIVIGFFLGMRHATDPDHVIAVTTIVSQQRSAKRAALIGIFWGLGHILTIFLVGFALILFTVVV